MNYTKAVVSEKSEDSFTAVASTEATDRHGEVVSQSGWDLKNFKQNPILLYMHDHTKPLGKATRIWIEKVSGKPKLMFKGMISTATDYGKAAKQLMDEGILNSFSVGFRIQEMDGQTITKAELHEISLVSVPANPEARRLALKSLHDSGFEDNVINEFVEPIDDRDEQIETLTSRVDELTKQVETAVKGLSQLKPHRSKQVVDQRLRMSKVIAKTADKLLAEKPQPKLAMSVKIMKRSSEMLIRDLKGDL